MPVAPIPLPADHFGVDQINLDQPGTAAGSWEEVLADPVGDPGATYEPRVWVKTAASVWARMPRFSSAALLIAIYVKDGGGIWRNAQYPGGSFPTDPVPCRIYVRT